MRTGRPTKLTLELVQRITLQIRSGLSLTASAQAVGISRPSLFRWLYRGRREASGVYQELVRQVEAASAAF